MLDITTRLLIGKDVRKMIVLRLLYQGEICKMMPGPNSEDTLFHCHIAKW
jgi:hypothetical protein